jgi:hypothetical protein
MVDYAPGDAMSGAGPPGRLMVRWQYRVKITNISKEDALEVEVIKSSDPQLRKLPVHHIKGLDHIELKRMLIKSLDKDVVVAAQHDFYGALEPLELREITMILCYKNSNGFKFYTDYARSRSDTLNMWPVWKPKFIA